MIPSGFALGTELSLWTIGFSPLQQLIQQASVSVYLFALIET